MSASPEAATTMGRENASTRKSIAWLCRMMPAVSFTARNETSRFDLHERMRRSNESSIAAACEVSAIGALSGGLRGKHRDPDHAGKKPGAAAVEPCFDFKLLADAFYPRIQFRDARRVAAPGLLYPELELGVLAQPCRPGRGNEQLDFQGGRIDHVDHGLADL